MFSGNLKTKNAVKVINAIEDGKFPLLLNRIAQFLSNGNSSKPFTPVEEAKLETSLEITKTEVESLIDGIIEIFLVSAYHVVKPSILGEQLEKGLHLNTKKAEIFVQVWASNAKGIIENLKRKSFFPQLNHVSYAISVETASGSSSKDKCPKAQLQLSLSSIQNAEDVNLEFNHEELYELYKKLEQIQGQLDALRLLRSEQTWWPYKDILFNSDLHLFGSGVGSWALESVFLTSRALSELTVAGRVVALLLCPVERRQKRDENGNKNTLCSHDAVKHNLCYLHWTRDPLTVKKDPRCNIS